MRLSRPPAAIDRRSVLAGGIATLASWAALASWPARAGAARRIAVLDWALLETLLAIGVTPIAAVELVLFRRLAVEPPVPASVVDLGLRGSFNLELLASLRPDLIYVSPFNAWAAPQLAAIGPTRSITIFGAARPPLAEAEDATALMGQELDRRPEAADYIALTRRDIAAMRERLAAASHRPVYLVNLGDSRHVRVFGGDSLFGSVMEALGFRNAFTGATRYAASAPVGIEAMAEQPEAAIVIVGPIPPDARSALAGSALWQAIPAVAAGRAFTLEPMNAFGALPTARRFTRLFGAALAATIR